LFLLACALRFFRLGDWSFWADELATLRDAGDLGAVRFYPVGYALIGWVVGLLGESEFAARVAPALAGAATVPVVYVIGRRLFSERAGVFAGAFLAVSTYHLFFSQFARYYTLLVLFGLVAMWAIHCGIEGNGKGWLLAGLVMVGVSFWTHWSAGLLVPALAVYLLWSARGRRPAGLNARNVALLAVPLAVAGAALVPFVWDFLRGWAAGGFSMGRVMETGAKLAWRMEAPLLILAACGAGMLLRRGGGRVKWLVAYAFVPMALVPFFVGFSRGGSRFGLVALPGVVLLAGGALDALFEFAGGRRRRLAALLTVLVGLSMVMKDAAYFTVEYGQRPRWREAGAAARGEAAVVRGRWISTSPGLLEHYGGGDVTALAGLSDEVLANYLAPPRGEKWRRAYVFVEHVANVAPRPSQWEIIRRYGRKVREWPVHVGPLDYSISLYTGREGGAELPGTR